MRDASIRKCMGVSESNLRKTVISGCRNMSSRYYVQLQHDAVVKYLFQANIKKNNPGAKIKDNREYQFVYKVNAYEYWWNI